MQSFHSHYPPIVSSKSHLQCRNHNNRIKTSSIKRKKMSNSYRPFLERRYVETRDPKIRARFSEIGHASPYYPKPMRVNARIIRRQQPPGRTRRKAPMYDRRVVEGPLSASNVEYLAESYPNFRTEPDREMSPSVADQKIGSILIHSAPPSMYPMSVHSAETSERFPEGVKKYIADRRVTADTASKSTIHTEEAHDLLTPVPTTKEHRASRVLSPSSMQDTSVPLWFSAPPLQPDRNQYQRRSFMDMPPTPFDIKEDTTAIAPSPAVRTLITQNVVVSLLKS